MIVRILIICVTAALLVGCSSLMRDPVTEDAELRAVAAADGTKKLESLEPLALAISHRVSREGGTLALKLAAGGMLRLENGRGDCILSAADCLHYIFAADLPLRHAFLVFAAHYEGGEWYLIDDRRAMRTQLDAPPIFSPDGARFLVVASDEAYSSFFGLEIYRREGDGAVLEWRRSLGGDAPEFKSREPPFCPAETIPMNASWQNSSHVTLELKSLGFDDCLEQVWPASIESESGAWRLITDWPGGG